MSGPQYLCQYILPWEMLICFHIICTNRVEQHSADILPIAVLQTRPAELTFGPHTEPTATDRLSVQSLLPALVTRAALRGQNAHGLWQTLRGWRISMAIPTWACWSAPSPCPRSCLCCGMLCCPGLLLWSHRLTSGRTGSFSHCDSSSSSAAICPPVQSQHRQQAKPGAQHTCEIIDGWTRYSKTKQLIPCETDTGARWEVPDVDRTFIPWVMSRHPHSWGFCKGVARSFPPLQSSQEAELYGTGSSVLSPPQIWTCVSEAWPSRSSSAEPEQNLVDNLLIISLWTCWTGWSNVEGVYQPEGWRTSAGLWWYSNLQRAWPAKIQQQRQEVRWPLMPTGQIKQCKRASGGKSHHGFVFLNVLVSFLKALG